MTTTYGMEQMINSNDEFISLSIFLNSIFCNIIIKLWSSINYIIYSRFGMI